MELSIPEGVSHVRGGIFPVRGFTVTVLVTTAPNFFKSMNPANSSA
jgi:hypothetical protein